MEISDTLMGAIIAGGSCVLTAIVGGVMGWGRDVVKSQRERVEQRRSEYVNKRIQAYEGFLAYCNAYVSFIKFVQKEMLASSAIEFIDKTSIWRDVFKPQEKYLAAVKWYGNPQIYVQVAHFFESVLSLLTVNDVRLDVLDKVVDFLERYKRIEYNSDLNQDVKYVVNALFYWFADRTQVKWARGASFVHLINKI